MDIRWLLPANRLIQSVALLAFWVPVLVLYVVWQLVGYALRWGREAGG